MNLAERLGFASSDRVLILNADDVGSTHAANTAAFECLEHGSLTSASILVPAERWLATRASTPRPTSVSTLRSHASTTPIAGGR
ncbi:MAG: ChbG/HpnK family deacetylase [Chloroflexi bacterium]|nr:ChbG/HpnK family deacetylase [Chloroflexota bacterium]